MSDFYWREDDTASDIVDVLRDANGNPVNLTGASVKLVAVPLKGGDPKIDDPAALEGPPVDGGVRYSPAAGDTDTPGDFLGTWVVTYSGGDIQSFPNAGYLLITVTPKAGEALTYVTVEELKKTLKLQGQTYADGDILVALLAAARGLDSEYGGPWSQGPVGEARFFSPIYGRTTVAIDAVDDVTQVAVDAAGMGAFDKVLVDGTDYRLEPVGIGPYNRLRFLRTGFAWDWCYSRDRGAYPFGLDGLRITGTYGHAGAPEGVKAATTIIATRVLRRMRETPFGGVIGLGLEGSIVRASGIARDAEISFVMKGARGRRVLVV